MSGIFSEIDEYIAAQNDEKVREILRKTRAKIRSALPLAREKISWKMPTFYDFSSGENLIFFAAFKKHLGIFPGNLANLPEDLQRKIAKSGRKFSTGAIQFPYDFFGEKDLNLNLIFEIAKIRGEN